MTIERIPHTFGRHAANRLADSYQPGIDGALALLETFYFAFNQRNLEVFQHVWMDNALIQLNNPLGGMLRGYAPIEALYARIFSGPARVWVEFGDIVAYATEALVVFAGRETGEFIRDGSTVALSIRTTRIVQWFGRETGWRQVHHHGSIDDPEALAAYQRAVRGE